MTEKANERIQVLVTAKEKKELTELARTHGLSLSSFVRMTLLKEAKKERLVK